MRAAAPAGALVIFGISGDLARKMTFRPLYHLGRAPPAQPYQRGSWGPDKAADLVRGHEPWLPPWLPGPAPDHP